MNNFLMNNADTPETTKAPVGAFVESYYVKRGNAKKDSAN